MAQAAQILQGTEVTNPDGYGRPPAAKLGAEAFDGREDKGKWPGPQPAHQSPAAGAEAAAVRSAFQSFDIRCYEDQTHANIPLLEGDDAPHRLQAGGVTA